MLPEPVATEVDGLRRGAGDRRLGRIAPHVTLVPPVNVAEADVEAALALLRRAAAQCRGPLELEIGPPDSFLPGTPVAYLAVSPREPLEALRLALNRPPIERLERRPFVAHVTIATDLAPERVRAVVTALADYRRPVVCTHVHLLEHRGVEGTPPRWETLADVRLGPPVVAGRGGLEVVLTESSRPDPEVEAFLAQDAVVTARLMGRLVAVAADEAWMLELLGRHLRPIGPEVGQE